MNIKKMLYVQKELDDIWMKRANLTEYPLEMTITAYRVELGELLQEWKQFKYWKMNKGEINRDKMLEEWADCMHFALSLDYNNYPLYYTEHYNEILINHLEKFIKNIETWDIYLILNSCFYVGKVKILENTLKLGLKLGYTLEELEQAYWRKNKINWERIKNNY